MANKKMEVTANVETLDNNNTTEQNIGSQKYVVVRAGVRVSDVEYKSKDDPEAKSELEFWKKTAKRAKDGSKTEIVEFDGKKHNVW
jgi:hypothetical protein